MSMVDSFEKIPVKIFSSLNDGSRFIAQEIATLIREKAAKGEKVVLGLATGSSPKSLYAELTRMQREEGLSFKNVVTSTSTSTIPSTTTPSRATTAL